MVGSGISVVRLLFWCWFWTVVVCDIVLVAVTAMSPDQGPQYGLIASAMIYGINLVMDPVTMWRSFQPPLSNPVACVVFYGSIAVGITLGWGTASLSWSDGLRVRRP